MATTDFVVKNGLIVNQNLDVKGTTQFTNTVTAIGALVVQGNTTLGNAASDTVSINGITTLGEIRYNNSFVQSFNYHYGFPVGTTPQYLNIGEIQKIFQINPSGNNQNYTILGKIHIQTGDASQTMEIECHLRSELLPNLNWEIFYSDVLKGLSIPFVKPVLWTKQTAPAGFIFGIEGLYNGTQMATVILDVINRDSSYYNNVSFIATPDIGTIDADFTSNDFILRHRTIGTDFSLTGDLTVTGGDITTSNATFNIGNTATTTQTLRLANSATASGQTKILEIGTGGVAGSTTNIAIGSASGGTATINSPNVSINGNVNFTDSGTITRGIKGTAGGNDQWFFGGGASATDGGFLEIATGDNGTEPIYFRQYSTGGPPGGTLVRTATLLDASGNTTFPGSVTGNTLVAVVAEGTAPFTVTSTTKVTNLNVDLLDGQDGTYYLDWTNVTNKPDPVVTVTLTGDVTGTGNATLIDLASGTISFATTIAADSVALGTDTTGNYVASITNGTYITGGNGGSEGAALTLAVDATSANTVSKVVARDGSGNFSAGTITATLSGNSSTTSRVLSSDTRAIVTTPETLSAPGTIFDFKENASSSLSDGGLYHGLMTFRTYGTTTDWSGGKSHQLGFTDNENLWHRSGTSTTWGTWRKLYESDDAATANTVSTLVLRDSSGNFSAGTITATLSGNATTATNIAGGVTGQVHYQSAVSTTAFVTNAAGVLQAATSGAAPAWTTTPTLTGTNFTSIPNSATTATSANTANAIVARDASNNFSAGTISATAFSTGSSTTNGVTTRVLTSGASATSGEVTGQWTLGVGSTFQATFADLAEWYDSDQDYEPGTVVVFGGEHEVTISVQANDHRVAGVVSTNPAFIMNVDRPGPSACVALQGKVPCKVVGKISKGDLLVTSSVTGYAIANNDAGPYKVIGKSLENKITEEPGLIYISVGR